ncbi:sensor histidine kinase [Bartonella sp. B10]
MQEKIQEEKDRTSDTKTLSLSEAERLAFREIAERLRGDLHSVSGDEHFIEETAVNLPCAQALPISVIEQALIKEPAVVLSLLDASIDGVLWLDEQGFIQSASSAALVLTGYEINELLAQPLSSLFTLQSRFLVEKYFHSIRVQGKSNVFNRSKVVYLVTKSHKKVAISVMIVPLAQQGSYAVMLHDMTEGVLLDKKVEENKMVGVVHEMRTPLNALIDFAEIMRDRHCGLIENERHRGYLRDIISSGKYMLSLVNRLLECSKTNHSNSDIGVNSSLMAEACNVISCLRASMDFLETRANHNGIIMRIVAPVHVPFICVSQQILRQIMWNLLSNAIRFTPSGGRIIVHVSYGKKERVKISVSDNGTGMSNKEIIQVMQPYGQVECKDGRFSDRIFIKSGLELPICKAMVEESGGQFLLFSKPNYGTTVEMFFPVFHG